MVKIMPKHGMVISQPQRLEITSSEELLMMLSPSISTAYLDQLNQLQHLLSFLTAINQAGMTSILLILLLQKEASLY